MPITLNDRELTPLLLIAGIAALVAVVYSPSYATMLALWQQTDHHHGLLVFPIVGYLLWRGRASIADARLAPWGWGIPILAGLVATWLLARAVGVQAAEHLAAVLMIPAAVAAFLGVDLLRRALFPLLFLVAAVPLADSLVPALMRVTADVSEALLKAAGVPVFREGQFMTLPGGAFEVADVCSGLRYLISGTIVALLFGYLTYRSYVKRAVLVAVTGIVLVAANGVRAFIVMYVASATDMQYFAGRDHVYFGWLLFGIVIVALLFIGGRYADPEHLPAEGAGQGNEGAGTRSNLLPLIFVLGFVMLAATARQFEAHFGNTGLLLLLAAAAGLLVFILFRRFEKTPAAASKGGFRSAGSYRSPGAAAAVCLAGAVLIVGPVVLAEPGSASRPDREMLAMPRLAGCDGPEEWSPRWQPDFSSPDFSGTASYRCADRPVHAFVAGYTVNLQGRELVGSSNRLIPSEWRRYLSQGRYRLTGEAPAAAVSSSAMGRVAGSNAPSASDGATVAAPRDVVEVRVEAPGKSSLIWYWYSVGDRTALRPLNVKLLQAYDRIVHGRAEGAVYLLETPLDRDLDAGRRRLAAAVQDLAAIEPKLIAASRPDDGAER